MDDIDLERDDQDERDDEPSDYELEQDEYWSEFDCGMTAQGWCTKVGSEECDFECPYSHTL